jgi:hypothetical protein
MLAKSALGFNVRGGGADQNLILDEATIFNSSHVLDFSLFLILMLPKRFKIV